MVDKNMLKSLINDYLNLGYHCLRIEHKMYSFNDYKGLLLGYTPYFNYKCRSLLLWSRKNNVDISSITIDDLCVPYTYFSPHQWWMKGMTGYIEKCLIKLRKADFNRHFDDFEDLYDYVLSLKITKGRLFMYDLTCRIGSCLGIYPEKFIYLQYGSEAGANILHDKGCISLPDNWEIRVPASVFASVLPGLKAMDIESFLCIYKAELKNLY